ncbi:MAG: RsmD family RNA methyltransferase, partial [Coriobacteriales bacterium]|nr:RsmD family RNA methyltransferase [Coriobacteriales bacterium]
MRIIAGELRGRHIDAVPGDETRPTTDRVREAIASSVISNLESGFEGTRALDAFAGCGALGFEAISRGSAFCLMVDDLQRAVSTIKANA